MQIFKEIGISLLYLTPRVSMRPAPYRAPLSWLSRLIRPRAYARKYSMFLYCWSRSQVCKYGNAGTSRSVTSLQKKLVWSKKLPSLRYRRHENIFFQYSKKKGIDAAGRARTRTKYAGCFNRRFVLYMNKYVWWKMKSLCLRYIHFCAHCRPGTWALSPKGNLRKEISERPRTVTI